MIDSVFEAGEATWCEDLLFSMDRNLPREEAYFTFSYSPIYVEPGRVGGVFAACTETTERMIGERRLRTLNALAARASEARTAEEACQLAWQCLAIRDSGVAFALIYLLRADGIRGAPGCRPDRARCARVCPEVITLSNAAEETEGWPLAEVAGSGNAVLVTDLVRRFGPLPGGMWPEPADRGACPPSGRAGAWAAGGVPGGWGQPAPRARCRYRTFFELVAGQVGHGHRERAGLRRGAPARRGAGGAGPRQDRLLLERQPRVPHAADPRARAARGRCWPSRASALAPADAARALEVVHRNGLRLLQPRQHSPRLLAHRGRPRRGGLRAHGPRGVDGRAGESLPLGHRARRAAAGRRLPAAAEPVYVDREMWEKIVLNLLSNAFKFTFEGEIAVSLAAEAGDDVELTVRDTGTGIPAEELPRMFERFHRVRERPRPHPRGDRHRPGAGAGAGAAPRRARSASRASSGRAAPSPWRSRAAAPISQPTVIGADRALASTAVGRRTPTSRRRCAGCPDEANEPRRSSEERATGAAPSPHRRSRGSRPSPRCAHPGGGRQRRHA